MQKSGVTQLLFLTNEANPKLQRRHHSLISALILFVYWLGLVVILYLFFVLIAVDIRSLQEDVLSSLRLEHYF